MGKDLGRMQLHDPRSREYEYPVRLPAPGKTVRHRLVAPNVDQFYLSACVGFSGTNFLNTNIAWRSRKVFNKKIKAIQHNSMLDNNDGIKNYSEATKRDPFEGEYPPYDEGSSALGLMRYWKEAGVITGYEWAFTFDQFLAALQRQPVLIGSWWYTGLSYPDKKGIGRASGAKQGGHEYLANAIIWHKTPSRRLIGCENSWGEEFGAKGKFYVPWDDMEHLIKDEGDVAIPKFIGG